jgi:hypothetical protein
MKHYVRAKEKAKRRAIEGVSLGRINGERRGLLPMKYD